MTDELFLQQNNETDTMTRRDMLRGFGTVAGVALAATAQNAEANTQHPVLPRAGKADPNGRFSKKVVLITGATSGIGEATAYAFAKEGAKVFFCGRRETLGKQVEETIRGFGGEATYLRADVRREEDVKKFVERCVEKYSRIDIAFNNAGVEATPKPTAERSLDEWNNVMQTNATGVFLSMKYELPFLLKQGGGIIINTASVSGHAGFATIGPYNASKHAIVSLTKVAALEYADKNIRINAIAPGAVDTPMLRRAMKAWNVSEQQIANDYPIKRLATPEEMARAVMFLASDEASVIVGTDLDVTGGYLTK